MRRLSTKTNVVTPDADFEFGRIQDENGSGNGTPVIELLYGDMHQFFEKLITDGGITANGLPEGTTNGYQLNDALNAVIAAADALVTTAFQAADAAVTSAFQAADASLQSNLEGQIAALGTAQALTFTPLSILNSWNASVSVALGTDGLVRLSGIINSATPPGGSAIVAQIPVGFRPASLRQEIVRGVSVGDPDAQVQVQIGTDGNIILSPFNPGTVYQTRRWLITFDPTV